MSLQSEEPADAPFWYVPRTYKWRYSPQETEAGAKSDRRG